jgi:phosphoribosylamine--glycine ligase
MAAAGYPEAPRTGDPVISLPADADDCVVFHAGTQLVDGQLVTSGGRVLAVTALGDSVRAAQRRAYDGVAQVRFAGQQYRTDIGHRAINRRATRA